MRGTENENKSDVRHKIWIDIYWRDLGLFDDDLSTKQIILPPNMMLILNARFWGFHGDEFQVVVF
jgi:hypothetical protein